MEWSNYQDPNYVDLQNQSKSDSTSNRQKPNDFSKVNCDSIYQKFRSLKGRDWERRTDTIPKYDLINYYSCIDFKDSTTTNAEKIDFLNDFDIISNEDGAIIGARSGNPFGGGRSVLMDYDLNVLWEGVDIHHFENETFTFACKGDSFDYKYYNIELGKEIYAKFLGYHRLISKKGKIIDDRKFINIKDFSHSYFQVGNNDMRTGSAGNRYGLMDSSMQIVIPIKYTGIERVWYYPKYYKVSVNIGKKTRWGLVNIKDKILLPFIYSDSTYEDERKYDKTIMHLFDSLQIKETH